MIEFWNNYRELLFFCPSLALLRRTCPYIECYAPAELRWRGTWAEGMPRL